MAYSELRFITEFSLFVALSVVYALLITLVLLPCSARWISRPESVKSEAPAAATKVVAFHRWLDTHRAIACGLVLGFVGLVLAGASTLEVNNHSSASFNEDTRIRKDADLITSHLGGIYPVNFWFSTEEPRALLSPAFVSVVETVTERLKSHAAVGKVISPNDFIKRINEVVAQDGYALPEPLSIEAVSQFLLLYENSNGQELRDVMDMNYQNARVVALFETDKASEFQAVIDDIVRSTENMLPPGVELTVTGYGAEIVTATEEVVYSQVYSTLSAFILIVLLLYVYFRSIPTALLGLVPLTLTILSIFALMALFGVSLDIGTALIIGITFGIGVDYAIHFITFLRQHLELGEDWVSAIESTLHHVAKPITSNSSSLALGFFALSLSSFAPLRQLGYFVSTSMILCAIISLVVLPLLFGIFKPSLKRKLTQNRTAGTAVPLPESQSGSPTINL